MIFTDEYARESLAEVQRILNESQKLELPPHRKADRPSSDMASAELRHYAEKAQRIDAVRRLKSALDQLTGRLHTDLEHVGRARPTTANDGNDQQPATADRPVERRQRSASDPPLRLPDKQFTVCDSMLTDMLQVRHFRTIYNIFVVILLMLLLNTVVHDLVVHGTLNVGLEPIRRGFRQPHWALLVWAQMQLMATAVYAMFRCWSMGRQRLRQSMKGAVGPWDAGAAMLFAGSQTAMLAWSVRNVFHYDLPIAWSVAVLMELTRFLMKNYAFVRTNVPRVQRSQRDDDASRGLAGPATVTFGAFVYFQFAPTLVYRDRYPRTERTRWSHVLRCCVEVVGIVFYVSFILERFLLGYFRTFGQQDAVGRMDARSMVVAFFGCVLPSTMANLCGFYCLLHAWMNGWAELMRFGDRQFYRDWWNAASFDVYYRTWNCVVHDWLYAYVYKDVYELRMMGHRATKPSSSSAASARARAKVAVFTLSAVFHEFILAVAFRFFYPVLFCLFLGVGSWLSCMRLDRRSMAGNVFLWFAIALGNGLCITLYCVEYFARVNCAVDEERWSEYFVPVSWRCNGLI